MLGIDFDLKIIGLASFAVLISTVMVILREDFPLSLHLDLDHNFQIRLLLILIIIYIGIIAVIGPTYLKL